MFLFYLKLLQNPSPIYCKDHYDNRFNNYMGYHSYNQNNVHILCKKCHKNIKSECKNCGELKCNESMKYHSWKEIYKQYKQ